MNINPKTPNEKENMACDPYASVIGSLIYAMMCTCLDVYYIVWIASKFQLSHDLAYQSMYFAIRNQICTWLAIVALIKVATSMNTKQHLVIDFYSMIVPYLEAIKSNPM